MRRGFLKVRVIVLAVVLAALGLLVAGCPPCPMYGPVVEYGPQPMYGVPAIHQSK